MVGFAGADSNLDLCKHLLEALSEGKPSQSRNGRLEDLVMLQRKISSPMGKA